MKSCPTCQRIFIDSQPDCPLDRSPLQPSSATKPEGVGRELGNYRLISHLGDGGMGSIYIAAHGSLKRYVAIKVMKPELATKRELVARFFEEARTVNSLKHPNIVESIDLVEDVIDGVYNVLELLRGPDLKARLAAGPIPIDSVLHIGAQIADALSAVHQRGIVHRDLKPENLILISRGGRDDFVKLIDFGVAQVADERSTGKPFGTAAYMAPEQAAGHRVDGRADVYSLGVLMFEMATGRHPFPSGNDHEYIMRHADETPPRASSFSITVPKALDELIARCLAKKPEERFESAAAVAVALRAIDPHKRASGGRAKWVVGAFVLAAAAGAGVYFVPQYLDAHAASPKPAPAHAPAVAEAPKPAEAAPAPAAPEEPTPDEAPAPGAATVEIEISSQPTGATVYRAGETIPLGKTPFKATLLQSNKKAHLRFELAGYDPHPIDVKVDESHEVTVKLGKAAPVAPVADEGPVLPPTPTPSATSPQKPKKAQREGTLDPFAPQR